MITRFVRAARLAAAAAVTLALATPGAAQQLIGYGATSDGFLFKFDLASPHDPVQNIGQLPFVPEGMDFRPGSDVLYAIDVGDNTTQLYTVNRLTAATTPVGAGFPSTGAGYSLTQGGAFGFDFNPTTLQGDGSARIRMVGTSGDNLRLNSDTGLIAAVDVALQYAGSGNAAFVDAVAYINSNKLVTSAQGVTTLFDMDTRSDQLSIQNPPNNGTLNPVGPFGVGVDAVTRVHFDILTDPADVDPGIGGDAGYAVLRRADVSKGAPAGSAGGGLTPWLLYNVNLATGNILGGTFVGDGNDGSPAEFAGGFATLAIPEPSSLVLAAAVGLLGMIRARKRA